MLVSMAILSIAITGAMSVSKFGFDHLSKTRDHQAASLFAHSHLAEVKNLETLSPGVYSGQYSDEYQWNLIVTSWSSRHDINTTSSIDALQLDLTVVFDGGERKLHTLVLRSHNSNLESNIRPSLPSTLGLREGQLLNAKGEG